MCIVIGVRFLLSVYCDWSEVPFECVVFLCGLQLVFSNIHGQGRVIVLQLFELEVQG